ncbi:MAG: LysM peptidoglycan-binding domain-containing protein [Ilumatobacteraceae bacterium]
MAAVIVTVLVASCSNDNDGSDGTLADIQTTTILTTAPVPVTTQARFYEVQSGDTLTKIAGSFGLPAEAIMQANAITDPNRIFIGQILILPLPSEVTTTTTVPVTTTPQATAEPLITTIAP